MERAPLDTPYDLRAAVATLVEELDRVDPTTLLEFSRLDIQVLTGMGGVTLDNWAQFSRGWAPNLAHPA